MKAEQIRMRNWDRWQTYRRDRGMPPWIKVYRRLQNNRDWIGLTDAERGQLVSMWILAADNNGVIPSDPETIKIVCRMSDAPNLKLFKKAGFLEFGATATPPWRQSGANTASERRRSDAPLHSTPLHITPEDSRCANAPIEGQSVEEWAKDFEARTGMRPIIEEGPK